VPIDGGREAGDNLAMKGRVVWSSDPCWKPPCKACGRTPCACGTPAAEESPARQAEPLRLSFRRLAKGSGVTRIDRLAANPSHKANLLSRLKKRLGCGGTVRDGILEIQGDHRDAVEAALLAEGFQVKRAGG